MLCEQATLNWGDESTSKSGDRQTLSIGQVAWVGGYQVRNFHGYYQSREGGVGKWQFHVSGFDASTTGMEGRCTLILADGGREEVPIDAVDRISVLGAMYGRDQWKH